MAMIPTNISISVGRQARCSRCGDSFSASAGHVCRDLGMMVPPKEEDSPMRDLLTDARQSLHDTRNTLAHTVEQLRAAGNRERTLSALLERLFRFTAGLQLGDQPVALQKERAAIVHEVIAVLSPQSAISDSMGDARQIMNRAVPSGGGGGGGGVMDIIGHYVAGASSFSWKRR
jgi:hypothetical protein